MLIREALNWLDDRVSEESMLKSFFAGAAMGMVDFFTAWGAIWWLILVIAEFLCKKRKE